LAAIDGASALRRRLSHYAAPAFLIIDEVGYLSYSNRHADILFELISRRYGANSTQVTTNRFLGFRTEVDRVKMPAKTASDLVSSKANHTDGFVPSDKRPAKQVLPAGVHCYHLRSLAEH
jgi:IstB-like ATP binding protein